MQGRWAFSREVAACILAALLASPAAAAPQSRERELAEAVVAGLREGTVEWMTVGSDRFPVIVREPERDKASGVVLIVPEPGAHADWPDVVRPLRLGLPRQGWQTVSVQMPAATAFMPSVRID